MQSQITRNNHYVPQWYQRGFLGRKQHKLHILNLDPTTSTLANGQQLRERDMEILGPKLAFMEHDLYTTRFGETLNDDIERFLFGEIDASGAAAVRAWIHGDMVQVHRCFRDFFVYLDAQKLRTPKGLDWILKHYRGLPHLELMLQMQALRQMHATMWSECVREVVSAVESTVKFIVSDHPVTVYHPHLPPRSLECAYPDDPGIDLVGSQTLFALDANHCLILTNLEYAQDPGDGATRRRRTNARFRGESLLRTDALIRGRKLSAGEVQAINHVAKNRARKYVAAADPAWLHPEQGCSLAWHEIATILLPKHDLWRFGGEIFIGHEDGTVSYRDGFGRTSKAHEALAKEVLSEDPAPEAGCGCGSGIPFGDCCSGLPPHKRPSWTTLSIRERNLVLCGAIRDILEMREETSWRDVRRRFSDEHVRRINEVFADLWPSDTQLSELLPRPQERRSRAVYMGGVEARTLETRVIGLLHYVDELVLVHPFINAAGVRPEFSPIQNPRKFKEQTMQNVLVLLLLESAIAEGRLHLVPDPLDYDVGFRQEISRITAIDEERLEVGPIDEEDARQLERDLHMRAVRRLPATKLKDYLRHRTARAPEAFSEQELDAVVDLCKRELEDDPLSLLAPLDGVEGDGEFRTFKGFARDTGLFVAALTGSFVYTFSDTQWQRLHQTDGVHRYAPDPEWAPLVHDLSSMMIEVPAQSFSESSVPPAAETVRRALREAVLALRSRMVPAAGAAHHVSIESAETSGDRLTYQMQASVPLDGFLRTDVSRLVITFGRTDAVSPVPLALLLLRRLPAAAGSQAEEAGTSE